MKRRVVVVGVLAALFTLSGAAAPAGAAPSARRATPLCHRSPGGAAAPLAAVDPYRNAVAAAGARGLQVWLEADLLKRWTEGKASLDAGVQRLVALAADPAVIGFKVADELGYGDAVQQDPACLRAFVTEVATAVHRAAPHAQLLIDLVVPDLGCAPGLAAVKAHTASCIAANDQRYPALTLAQVDELVRMRAVDVIDLSTGLLDDATYAAWGTDLEHAQEAAWREVARRHWSRDVSLNGRKALAHPDAFPGTPQSADTATSVFVNTPLDQGARAVDVWTWRQQYEGAVYRLADPGLQTNALWDALATRHDQGAFLFTHFSPSSVEQAVEPDLDMIARVFRGLFVATGTG